MVLMKQFRDNLIKNQKIYLDATKIVNSVTRLGDLLDFWKLFKAFGNK